MVNKEVAQTIEGAITRLQNKRDQERTSLEAHIERVNNSQILFRKADSIISGYGQSKQVSMDTGAGRGIYGFRYETTYIRQTPDIIFKLENDSINLSLKDVLKSAPGYQIIQDSIILVADDNPIYRISQYSVEYADEELQSQEEFIQLSAILDFMEEKLKENQDSISENKPAGDESPESARIQLPPVFKEPPSRLWPQRPQEEPEEEQRSFPLDYVTH